MRLLSGNGPSLQLVEFAADIPRYAILSHRWEADEFLFADVENGASDKSGFCKVHYAMEQAKLDGYQYLWVDPCCIDKTNSTELSETINSMFRWYRDAAVCYAYLSDVEEMDSDLEHSQWFTRGWTLQELLAPANVLFFSRDWIRLGTKVGLSPAIASITGIHIDVLNGARPIISASVAQRMSWAAKRSTTRTEDIAYCLLGVFDVNMPLVYGEGSKAFLRLRERIANESDDHTLFAWKDPSAVDEDRRGLLADSPAFFADSGYYVPCDNPNSKEPFSINKRRVKIEVYLLDKYIEMPQLAILSCTDTRSDFGEFVTICVAQTSSRRTEFSRFCCKRIFSRRSISTLTTVFIPQARPDGTIGGDLDLPRYFINFSGISSGFLTQVQLTEYVSADKGKDGKLSSDALQQSLYRHEVSDIAAFLRRDYPFACNWCPDHFGVELAFTLERRFVQLFVERVRVKYGITSNMKLGFGVTSSDPISKKLVPYSLTPWNGRSSVVIPWISEHITFYSHFKVGEMYLHNPRVVTRRMYSVNLKITSEVKSKKSGN